MKLKNIQITNFRCFDSLSIDLDEQLTVLVAKNGQGKTTILDAIRIGLWSFVGGFDLAKNPYKKGSSGESHNIQLDDVKLSKINNEMTRNLPCSISLCANQLFYFTDDKFDTWTRTLDSEAKGASTKNDLTAKKITDFTKLFQYSIKNREYNDIFTIAAQDVNLPVICYYGTGRLWNKRNFKEGRDAEMDSFMRLIAYRDCLNPDATYEYFAKWFKWVFDCHIEYPEKRHDNDNSVWENIISVVQEVINTFLKESTGWHSLKYSPSHEYSFILNHDQKGTLKVEQLSDGIRSVLAMVGDIAYRCIKLNPHLGLNAAKETQGVIMIDEVDMHLHPAWQQTVLVDLIKAFPKIQFIVTTHSPQVISTVPSHQIRILDENNVYSAEAGTQGAESSRILKRIFCVESRPKNDPNTKLLNKYLDLVYSDKWVNAEAKKEIQKIRQELDAIYQGNDPALTEADLYIENRQWELDIEEN
jgi:predicted ATP-binding protein involved in virulence